MTSRFAARARKVPSRAVRYRRSPQPPAGATLFLRLAMRRVAAAYAKLVRQRLFSRLGRWATRTDAAETDDAIGNIASDVLSQVRGALGRASEGAAKKAVSHSKNEFTRLGLPLIEHEPAMGPAIQLFREKNLARITSLLDHEVDRLRKILEAGASKHVSELRAQIEEHLDVTRAHAELLARDQVLSLNADITQARQKAAGIDKYIWTTAGDERVRESHDEVDGEEFSWDDPPEIDGERVHPGDPVNCRCVAYPILPELE